MGIPKAVYRELLVLGESTTELLAKSWCEIRAIAEQSELESFQKSTRLDRGESEAILLAQQLGAQLLLIDERRGRAEAQRLGIRVTGLLGILVEAKRQKLIVAVKPLMDQLIASSAFRISPELYKLILNMATENESLKDAE